MKTDPYHCLQCTYAANISLSPVRLFTVEQEAAELRLQLTRAEADLKEKEREGGEMLEALAGATADRGESTAPPQPAGSGGPPRVGW